jgi:hypothetical protein
MQKTAPEIPPCPRCGRPRRRQKGCGTRLHLAMNLAGPLLFLGAVGFGFLVQVTGIVFAGAGLAAALGLVGAFLLGLRGARFAVNGVTVCSACGRIELGRDSRPGDARARLAALELFGTIYRCLAVTAGVSFLFAGWRAVAIGGFPSRDLAAGVGLGLLALLSEGFYRVYLPPGDSDRRIAWLVGEPPEGAD